MSRAGLRTCSTSDFVGVRSHTAQSGAVRAEHGDPDNDQPSTDPETIRLPMVLVLDLGAALLPPLAVLGETLFARGTKAPVVDTRSTTASTRYCSKSMPPS